MTWRQSCYPGYNGELRRVMNINITVWPGLTDNYFIFALPDFQLSGRKGNLFDYFELRVGNIETGERQTLHTQPSQHSHHHRGFVEQKINSKINTKNKVKNKRKKLMQNKC